MLVYQRVLETINQTMFVVGTPRPCQEFLGFIKVHKDLEAQVAPDVGDCVPLVPSISAQDWTHLKETIP